MEIETGYIYCISNVDIMPGIYKVGVTMRSPLDRLKEANSSETWKIPYYKIEFAKKVTNPKEKERTLHRLMEKFMKRVHPRREFFRGDINDIKEAFKLMDGDIWNENPPEPVIHDEPIHFENRLSEDSDIRIRQIMELIQKVFKDHTVQFKENGKRSGQNHYPVIIDYLPLFIIENHNNGGRNIAMLTTVPRNKVPDFINDYYRKLTWDTFGNLPRAIRKQYDTEGKTKEDIINILEGFKTILPKQGGEKIEEKIEEKEEEKEEEPKIDLKKKEVNQYNYSMNHWYDNIKNWMVSNNGNDSSSVDSDDSHSQSSDYNGEEINGMKQLEICKPSKAKDRNYWVLYNKKNHRCNNRRATYNELKYALDNWNTTEIIKPPCKVYIYPKEEYNSLLEKSLLINESKEGKEVIYILGQDWGSGWNRVIFYNFKDRQYYLRSFTKSSKRNGDGKELRKSRMNGWYVDLSTMGAPREFWDYLKENLEDYNSSFVEMNDPPTQVSEEINEMKEFEICKPKGGRVRSKTDCQARLFFAVKGLYVRPDYCAKECVEGSKYCAKHTKNLKEGTMNDGKRPADMKDEQYNRLINHPYWGKENKKQFGV